MRVLLSTGIGSRGDVQPLVALAARLRAAGHEARLCVPPDFRDFTEGLGFPVTPIGPWLRKPGSSGPQRVTQPQAPQPREPQPREPQPREPQPPAPGPAPQGHATGTAPERLGELTEGLVAEQFATIAAAARGCDVIVETALQVAARSVAEMLGIGYVFAAFCPAFLPSPRHAPPPLREPGPAEARATAANRDLWSRHAERFDERFGPALNRYRAAAGLAPVTDVRDHIFTRRPWLAADPVLAPWPGAADEVFQTGAWILPDERALDPELEAFLQAADAPVYFGFGSMRVPPRLTDVIAQAARQAGRRAIVGCGSAGLGRPGSASGCLVIGEVNQQRLFQRVAAVVHHGGAGTTTAAALAGAPQVIVPQAYDQRYWARRVSDLGIGTAHAPGPPEADSLAAALDGALRPGVATRARSLRAAMSAGGAQVAVSHLLPSG
jgi:vancomycin aglycone glucosyltransferase